MQWWRDAKFGMFIHWGLYSEYGGTYKDKEVPGLGEWIQCNGKIPVADYAKAAAKFNPTKFDAREWVAVAKAAGVKYIVITAKHHEGFAMYHTAVDKFNIVDATPFKRDPLAELAAECRKQGIKFGVYYSQAQDWHHKGGATYVRRWDATAQDGSFDGYIRHVAIPQVLELMASYHPDILWWDTPVKMSIGTTRALLQPVADNPGLITNDRLGRWAPGDIATAEQRSPKEGFPGKDWESCMTVNDTWGYKKCDTDFKSAKTLIRNLVDIASKGGNYLINVGPDATGTIPAPEVERLVRVGKWLSVNGESIYDTSASPHIPLPAYERATRKGDTLYLHVLDWSSGPAILRGLAPVIESASSLASHQQLAVTKGYSNAIMIAQPVKTDPIDTVIVVKLKGPIVEADASKR